jgi:N-acetylmuramic acid 6-phosphate etherase
VLNLFSTAVMIQLGRVYAGLMVEMQPTNAKLRQRAEEMVVKLTGCDTAIAAHALARSGGKVKLAVLVVAGLDVSDAKTFLEQSGGSLRAALATVRGD